MVNYLAMYGELKGNFSEEEPNGLRKNCWYAFATGSLILGSFLFSFSFFLVGFASAQGVIGPGGGVGPGSGGNNPVGCQLNGPATVVVGHSADFVITGFGGNGNYSYLACHSCTVVPNENPGLGEPQLEIKSCPPGEYNPVYPNSPNVYVVCGDPIGTQIVRARVEDTNNATSVVAERQIEVLPPNDIKLVNKTFDFIIHPQNNFTISPVFEIDIMRFAEKIGPCATVCAQSAEWFPPNQPGNRWNPKDNEPTIADIEICKCGAGLPGVNCISPPTHFVRPMAGPFNVIDWDSTAINKVFRRMAFKVRYVLTTCSGQPIVLETGTIKVTFKKTGNNTVRVTAQMSN